MGKWLAAGGIVILALLLLLLREMKRTEAQPASTTAHRAAAPDLPAASPATPAAAARPTDPAPAVAADEPAKPAKLDPRTDEFFYKFDEAIPKVLTRNAAKCYEGRHGQLHRNQKLVLKYKVAVVDGEVRIREVEVKESTLNDPALETCFIQEVQRSTWKDPQLPDVGIDDELVLRPERGMKKYWKDNVDYVGAQAPPQ